jgi:hypothetical protein
MLQDFDFKIVHRTSAKHGNVDALSCNPISPPTEDKDFVDEIQDLKMVKKMGIQIWVGKRSLRHDGIAPRGFELP